MTTQGTKSCNTAPLPLQQYAAPLTFTLPLPSRRYFCGENKQAEKLSPHIEE